MLDVIEGGFDRNLRTFFFRIRGGRASLWHRATSDQDHRENDKMNSHTPEHNTVFEASVRALSHKGHGVVDAPNGGVFFAKGTWPGDVGLFPVARHATNYDYADI